LKFLSGVCFLHIGDVILDGKMIVSENWKECERKRSYPRFKYHLTAVVKGMRKDKVVSVYSNSGPGFKIGTS
jgi:hypothetical protein